MTKIKLAVLGCGGVGAQVVRLLIEQKKDIDNYVGTKVELVGIGVKNIEAVQYEDIDKKLFTTDCFALIDKADIVIELIGGVTDAKEYVVSALSAGKTVVTANKMLLSHFYEDLLKLCKEHKTELYYEASVCAAVPIVYALRESLRNDKVESVMGIVNSSTNYILDLMYENDISIEEAISQAQNLGFVNIDFLSDLDGIDIASKAAILASLAFSMQISIDQVDITGMRNISMEDIKIAKEKGYVLKYIFVANRREDFEANGVYVSVRPTLLPLSHPLATVKGIYNAVTVEAEPSGRLMFYGQGIGEYAAASAVLNDITRASVHKQHRIVFSPKNFDSDLKILGDKHINARFYMNLTVDDRPGVLSQITGICAQNNLSIDSLIQDRKDLEVRVSIFTHETTRESLKNTIEIFKDEPGIIKINSVLYLENN